MCRSDVCHKGRIGRQGFCRLGYWHWVRSRSASGEETAVRAHGMPLHQRWRGGADPPVCAAPPFRGAPALETTHPFHIKMNPAICLGPRCNHDLGVLLRFLVRKVPEITARVCPDAVPEVASLNSGGSDQTASAPIRSNSTHPHNDRQVRARRVLSRLLSSTNRRMHKGFLCTGCKISGSGIVAYHQIRQQ